MILLISVLLIWTVCALGSHTFMGVQFSKQATVPLRGLLATGIVLHHLSLRLVEASPDCSWLWSQFSFWGAPIVAVFFFLSGYGLMVSLITKGQKYLDGFLKKRLLKIVLPLVLCSIVFEAISITLWGGKLLISERTGLFCPTVGFVLQS